MSTIGTTLFSKIEINGQEVDIATLDANDGIYALPAGQTTANVKFTMIDNTSIPRGVFEENSYITAMTLPDAMTYIASYSFHGVNNINISDKNAILAINPYAFDAELGPTPPTPTPDPDFYFKDSNYEIISGREVNMKYNLTNNTQIDTNQHKIQWSSSSSDIQIKSQTKGTIKSYKAGATGTITATLSDGTNTHTATCTVSVVADKGNPVGQWYNNGNPIYYIDVVQGGSTTYTLTFSGTPSDSWTFSIVESETINGVSIDSTGTITINESQLDTTLRDFAITAIRPEDASYYEGVAQISINVQSSGTQTDPDIYFMSPSLSIDYQNSPNQLNGTEVTQALSGNDASSSAWITWMTNDSSIATVNHGGYVIAHGNGTVNIAAEYTAHDNYNSKTVQYQLTITNYSSGKTTPYAHWYENGTELSELILVQGGSGTHTLTFSATPSDSWSFMDPMFSGISVDTTTGTITITEANLNVGNISISANRSEDSSYYYGSANLSIRVLPTGSDPKFFYEQESVNLDNQSMTTSTPMLHDEYMGLGYTKTYASADTNVATVDAYGMISFVGAGNTTVTATATNGTDTHTATINVYCSVMKQYPSASFEYNGASYSGGILPVAALFSGTIRLANMTPSDGWVITDPMIQGITVSGYEINAQGLPQGTYYINVNRAEDSSYYSGMTSLTLRVLPSGTNPNFYYEQESVNLDNQAMTTSSPMLINNTGFAAMPTYQSADTTIATVDNYGMISFVSAGNTIVTASITNGVDTYTTTINVYCNTMNA